MNPPRLLVLATLLIAAAGCGRRDLSAESESRARPKVATVTAEWHVFARQIEAPGQWRSATETVVSAPFDAVIESVTARPGDRVTRGAVIARWTTYESQAAVEGARMWREQAADSVAARDGARALAAARAAMVSIPVKSPVSGVVIRRSADPGARLASGAELLAIVPDDDVVFEARLGAADANVARKGTPAVIEDGAGPPRTARVLTRLPSAGGDQAVLVWLSPSSAGARPDLGRFGTALIRPGTQVRALAVPDSAILEDDLTGAHRVAAVDSSGHVAWLDVRPGPRDGDLRGVEGAGLAPGIRVIVAGQRALADGAEVDARP